MSPNAQAPYSDDLRWRVVYQREGLGLSYERIAANLSSVSKKKYDKSSLTHKLTDVVQFFILQLVIQRPGILLRGIKAEVCRVLSVEVEESTVCKFLHSQGFTHQKMQIVANMSALYTVNSVTYLQR